MRIIEIQSLSNGAHRNQQGDFATIPTGWAVIPGDVVIPETFPFVDIVTDGQKVVSMTAGVVPDPEPEPDPEPNESDDLAAMTVDHEYHLTLLELGLSEGGDS